MTHLTIPPERLSVRCSTCKEWVDSAVHFSGPDYFCEGCCRECRVTETAPAACGRLDNLHTSTLGARHSDRR